ncbi:MAG TPA: SpoIIE family protein phosphatase [Candidatus Saccharimonadales bacterium]|nr:SpoIIE family protein phosphatase [Candidatus Saccharimonadales bacterium]
MPLFLSGHVADRFMAWPLEAPHLGLGRSSRHAVHLPDATVSKDHAEIIREGTRLHIRDLGSRNGTRVNGVSAAEPLPLAAGDQVEIGQLVLRVTEGEPVQRVRLQEAAALGTSVRLRVDQMLERPAPQGQPASPQVVRLLAEAGRLLVLPRPLRETCDEVLALVERAVPASRYVLLLREAPGAEPVQMAARSGGGRADQPLALSRSILSSVLEECTSVLTEDASADPRFLAQQSVVSQAVRAAMAVPLFDNEKVLGLIYVDTREPSVSFRESDLELLSLLANMAAVKITNARLLEAEQQRARLAQELATATRIQRALLPPGAPRVPGWAFEAFLETCHEVGGDLYDFHVQPDGRILFLVGDVSGKGVGASLLMSSFLASARVLAHACDDLGRLATQLNHHMCETTEPMHFVTGFVGRLDPATGELRYVNAGHPPPLVVRDGGLRRLDGDGLPFGVMEKAQYTEAVAELQPGELLALYTDGIPEARSGDELFEDERLERLLAELPAGLELPEVRRRILERVADFVGAAPRGDDITLVLVRREAQ